MNVDAVKWLADYEKIISIDSLKLNGNEFVLAYDINNPEMYERLWRSSGSLLVVDDADFFSRWQKKLEIDALLKKEDVPTLVVYHSIKDAIARMNNGNSNVVVCLEIEGKDDEFCREFANEWERNNMRKFELIVMNPPYNGRGKPLFMEIAKTFYDICLKDDGKIVSINPTSVTDNTYDGLDDHSKSLKENYGGLKVEDYKFSPEYRNAFDASIGTGICIVTYSKSGKYNLWSDYAREIRFGKKNWDMRKSIIEKVARQLVFLENKPTKGISSMRGFTRSVNQEEVVKHLVVVSRNRGNVSSVSEHKWDWTTLQSFEFLKIQTKHPEVGHYSVNCESKMDAVNLLKWFNTDFIMFITSHYKTQISNNPVMWHLLPQPPAIDGNYSDEVLMKHFNLTQEEMDWIHSEMKNFGWKVSKDVNLPNQTESELMAYIDEINK